MVPLQVAACSCSSHRVFNHCLFVFLFFSFVFRINHSVAYFCFSETWLHSHITDNNVEVPGYGLVWGDRDCYKSQKKKGGGLALNVSERWCNPGHVNVKECLCTPDIELLAVGMRRYYLPRELMSTIVITIYIPPQLMQQWPVKSSAPPLLNYRLNIRMHSWLLQVILIMSHWTKL